jgi:hypothetical protein
MKQLVVVTHRLVLVTAATIAPPRKTQKTLKWAMLLPRLPRGVVEGLPHLPGRVVKRLPHLPRRVVKRLPRLPRRVHPVAKNQKPAKRDPVGSSQTAATRARPQRNRPAKNRLERPRTSRGSFCILWIEDYYHRCIMRVDMSFLEVGTRNKNYTFFFDSKLEKLSLPCIYHRLAVSSYSSYSKR